MNDRLEGHPDDSSFSLRLETAREQHTQQTFQRLRDLADEIEQQFGELHRTVAKVNRLERLLAVIAVATEIKAVHDAIREDAANVGATG